MAESQSAKAARIRAGKTAPASNREVTTTDNLTPEQELEAFYEREEAQLISIMDQLKRTRAIEAAEKAKVDAAKLVHKDKTEAVNKVFKNAAVLGFKRVQLEEHYGRITEKGIRKNQQAEENRRARWARYWNLPVADTQQAELDARLPPTEKDGQDYESDGYKAGLNSEERKAPAVTVKAGHDQRWLTGYDAATARKAWGLTAAKAIPLPGAKPTASAAPPAEPAGEAV